MGLIFELIDISKERRKEIRSEREEHLNSARTLASARTHLEEFFDQHPFATYEHSTALTLLRIYIDILARRLAGFYITPTQDESYVQARWLFDHPNGREMPMIRQKYLDGKTKRSDLF